MDNRLHGELIELFITVDWRTGQLICRIPSIDYSYIVRSWSDFMEATGTANIDDYRLHIKANGALCYV